MLVKDKKFYKAMIAICVPIALQSMISFGVNMMDTLMVGSLGEIALSAASLSGQIFFVLMVLNFGLGGGAAVLTAQFWGKKDKESVKKTLSMISKFSLVVSLIFMFAALMFPEVLLKLYTNEQAVIEAGVPYIRLVALMYPIFSVMTTTSIVLRTVGEVKISAIANGISFGLNVLFNYIFIFGKFGAPAMGLTGAAVGTIIARFVEGTIVLTYLLKYEKKIDFNLKDYLGFDKDIFKKYIKLGVNVLISDALLVAGLTSLTMIMGRMGSEMVAANSISSIVMQLATILVGGLASASSIMTGNNVGKGNYEKARKEGITFLIVGIAVGIIGAIIIVVLKPVMISFYNVSDSTKEIAYQLMNTSALIVLFQTPGGILTKGVLRGGGDTKFLMIADVLFLWVISIPLGFMAGLVWTLPPAIVFLCLKIDEIIKCLWCAVRVFGDKWIVNIT